MTPSLVPGTRYKYPAKVPEGQQRESEIHSQKEFKSCGEDPGGTTEGIRNSIPKRVRVVGTSRNPHTVALQSQTEPQESERIGTVLNWAMRFEWEISQE